MKSIWNWRADMNNIIEYWLVWGMYLYMMVHTQVMHLLTTKAHNMLNDILNNIIFCILQLVWRGCCFCIWVLGFCPTYILKSNISTIGYNPVIVWFWSIYQLLFGCKIISWWVKISIKVISQLLTCIIPKYLHQLQTIPIPVWWFKFEYVGLKPFLKIMDPQEEFIFLFSAFIFQLTTITAWISSTLPMMWYRTAKEGMQLSIVQPSQKSSLMLLSSSSEYTDFFLSISNIGPT